MLVIKDKADIKIEYPIEKLANKDKVVFFDIETTGFSRQYCNVYLIGCLYFCGEQPMYAQWLADNFNDEANVLMAFHKFIQKYDTLIHFNGNSFDIPFLKERGEKYKLDFQFDKFQSIDIYKPLSRLHHILKTENQKQKTFEQLLGLKRKDPFTGGDLIEVFKQYVESKDERLIFPLLLHNKEDVWNMGHLISLLSISDLFDYHFKIADYKISEFKNINGDTERELLIAINLTNKIPISISYNYDDIYLRANGSKANLSIKVKSGTYKYFFDNYKDYYYLPLEDRALHKSVASFVDKQYRKPATASTCYEKVSGDFLPMFDLESHIFSQYFKEENKSKYGVIKLDCLKADNIFEYCKTILNHLKVKPQNYHSKEG